MLADGDAMRRWLSESRIRRTALLWFVSGGVGCGVPGARMDASWAGDGAADVASRTDANASDLAPRPDGAPSDLAPQTDGPASDAQPDAPPSGSVFKLSDTSGLRLQVASDRTGHPVVMWTDALSAKTAFVYWDAASARWVPLPAVDQAGLFIVDPNGSGRPLVWQGLPPTSQTSLVTTVRRFDPAAGAWSAVVNLPDPPSLPLERHFTVDAAGNAHTFWRNTPGSNYWSWWRADAAAWEAATPFDEQYALVAGPTATFMWFERNALGVRRFDAQAGTWSAAVQLADLTQEPSLRIHTLVVGPDDAPMMVSFRRDPDQLTVEAWHGTASNAWGGREPVEAIPIAGDPNTLEGPIGALANPGRDFLWVPSRRADGTHETHVDRYDPELRAWELSRVLRGAVASPRLDLRADKAGRIYGCTAGTLLRFTPGADTWQDTPVAGGTDILRASDGGAFVVGFANGDELVAFRSDAGGAWRPARGYSGGAHPSVGSVAYDMAIAGPDRAVLVWTVSFGADAGVWAAFLD